MPEQTMRYTDEELSLIKETFKDNLPLLKAIRKVFLQLNLTEAEDIMVKKIMSEDVSKIMYKAFLPTLDGDAPLGQVIDLMMTVDISNKFPEEAINHLKARDLSIKYIGERLASIKSNTDGVVLINLKDLDITEDATETYINITARNTIILLVENQLRDLNTLANQASETEEERETRLQKESNK